MLVFTNKSVSIVSRLSLNLKPLNAEAPRRRRKNKREENSKSFISSSSTNSKNKRKTKKIFAFLCAPQRLCASALRGFAFSLAIPSKQLIDTNSLLNLRIQLLNLRMQFIQCRNIGFRRCHYDIRICTHTINDTPCFAQAYSHLTLRLRASSDRVYREQ